MGSEMSLAPLRVSFPHEGEMKVITIKALFAPDGVLEPISFETEAAMKTYVLQRFDDWKIHIINVHTKLSSQEMDADDRRNVEAIRELGLRSLDAYLNKFLKQYPS